METKNNIVEDIKTYQGYGFSKSEIKESLLHKNYTESEIDEALKNAPNIRVSNNSYTENESPWKLVLSILTIMVVIYKVLKLIYIAQQ